MPFDEAQRLIVEAAALQDFGKVTFTGGEPFMYPDELEQLLALCRGLGLETRVVTNGFWAKNRARGYEMLRRMQSAGLTEINFSADRYHLEFLPAQTLRHALDCAKMLGFVRIISFVSNADRDPLDEFSDIYGIPRGDLFDLRFIGDDPTLIEEIGKDHILIFYGGLIGLGRALESPEELRYHPIETFPLGKPCGEIVNKPVIYPDGSFQACCCAGGKIRAFTVGNTREEDLATLYERMQSRSHFRLINTHGPRQLMHCIKAARPDLPLPSTYTSICELCVKATERLTAEDVDHIADDFLLRETLAVLGVEFNREKLAAD
jgi:MoaA/NifB/PqqE/SkfB family radical SAM enzyme